MKKLFIGRKGRIILKEVRTPLIEYIGSIIQTSYALISAGTELTTIKNIRFQNQSLIKKLLKSKEFRNKAFSLIKRFGFKKFLKFLLNYLKKSENKKNFASPKKKLTSIGYSSSGIIQKTNVENYNKNDKIACAGSNHAEVIYCPKNLSCKIPNNVSLEEAAFTTIGAIALHSIHRAKIKPGEFVGVIGTGLIGLIVVQLARVSGAIVFAIDLINKRLKLAKRFGAKKVINPKIHLTNTIINEATNGNGLDKIIIAASSKSPKPLEDAVDLIRKNGKIVMLGGFPIKVDRTKLYYKEADLLISTSYGPGRYDPYYEDEGFDYPIKYVPWTERRNMELFLQLISEKKIDVKSLITDIIPFEKAHLAYNKLESDPINNLAVLLEFRKGKSEIPKKIKIMKPKEVRKKLIIGLIGCGQFAQKNHLPHLLSDPCCKIKGICDTHKPTVEFCKTQYNPEYITTNYKKILNDPEINTVFIYTRHDTHEKFTIETLKSNKNVFVEKPMALTWTQCINIYNSVKKYNKNYIIGFNRRHSPLIKLAKELLKNRNNPIIINYRIANYYVDGNHWLFDPKIGGGPIIGEFCHFIDLILYLMKSKPIELIARGGSLSHKNTPSYDSLTEIIKFQDNSIANLIYSDLSGEEIPKERIEIFCGESAIIIDDFKKMETNGFDIGNKRLNEQDKGLKNEVKNVIRVNLGLEKPLVNVNDALKAMNLCFKTIESIKNNSVINIKDDDVE